VGFRTKWSKRDIIGPTFKCATPYYEILSISVTDKCIKTTKTHPRRQSLTFICTTGRGSCLYKEVTSTHVFTCAGNNQVCEASFVLCNVRHRAIAASFSPQRHGLNLTVVNVRFLVGKVPDGKVSVCAPPFPLINYHSTNVPYQTSSRLVQQALYEATVSGDSLPPLKLLTQNLFQWRLANYNHE
jgi:hypothetical protein